MSRIRRTTLGVLCAVMCCGGPTLATAQSWLNADWTHRVRLTAKNELLPATGGLTDFTALLRVDDSNLSAVFDTAKADGSDLLFTSGDGVSILGHELVSYDSTNREAEIWFKVDELSAASNVFYLYFGNPDTTVVSGPGWSPDHLAVYHFETDPGSGSAPDSGPGNGENLALTGSSSTWGPGDVVAGQIGGGWYFDGADDWLYAPSISSSDSSFTVSAWYANSDDADGTFVAMNPVSDYWSLTFRRSALDPNGGLETADGTMYWRPDVTDTNIHHFVWSLDAEADTARFYLDGVERAVKVNFVQPGSDAVYEGLSIDGRVGIASPAFGASVNRVQGIVDEFRIVEDARNADWIATEFNNQSDPVGFFEYKIELEDPVTAVGDLVPGPSAGRIRVWPNPVRGMASIDVALDSPRVEVNVYDVAGRLVRNLGSRSGTDGLLRLQWDGRDFSGRPVSRGVYYVRATGGRSDVGTKFLLVK